MLSPRPASLPRTQARDESSRSALPLRLVAGLALSLLGSLAASASGLATLDDYEQMRALRFGPPQPVGLLELTVDDAAIQLDEGTVASLEPVSGDLVTGLVFRGSGRFQLAVPDRRELDQLRRFVGRPDFEGMYFRFDLAVIRASPEFLRPVPTAPGPYAPHELALDRRDQTERLERLDVDSRLIAALRNDPDRYLRAELRTEELGWVTFVYDESKAEEIEVRKTLPRRTYTESWLGMDRSDERDQNGRPTSIRTDPLLTLTDLDARIDATERGGLRPVLDKDSPTGIPSGWSEPIRARIEACTTYRVKAGPLAALSLSLDSRARLDRVQQGDRELETIRHQFRDESSARGRLFDQHLLVLLPEPLPTGRETRVCAHYDLDMHDYVNMRTWYPTPRNRGGEDRYPTRIEIRHPARISTLATGRLTQEKSLRRGIQETVWTSDRPVDSALFTLVRGAGEASYSFDGLPEITAFGSMLGYMSYDKLDRFAAWAVNATNFFQITFRKPMGLEQLVLAVTSHGDGQAADGVVLIPSTLAHALPAGIPAGAMRELLVAHEVAHQWWGHQVRYGNYRDQWLSEALAEYSAILFVEASVPRGRQLARRTLIGYADEVAGRATFGAANRGGRAIAFDQGRHRIGPISLGRRANTVEARRASSTLIYKKGVLVLHTLRSILHAQTGSDQLFLDLLAELASEFAGSALRTDDLLATVNRLTGEEWGWFFHQWIDGTELPKIDWTGRLEPLDGGATKVAITARQHNVDPGFRSILPIEALNDQGERRYAIASLDQEEKSFEIEVDDRLVELTIGRRLWVLGMDP